MQNLRAAWNALCPFGERRRKIAVVGSWTLDDRHGADGQTDVRVGVFGLQKARIKRGQMLHTVTLHLAAVTAGGSQVPYP